MCRRLSTPRESSLEPQRLFPDPSCRAQAASLPAGDRAAELASVLRLWIHVRGLVNDPNGLDTREQDRALLERLR